jgi:hypothetical protein
MSDITRKRVEANMRRWQGSRINHKNPDHVAAYLLCKQTNERPRVDQVLAVLVSQQMQHEASSKMCNDLFVIMKQPVEPHWLKDWGVSEEELRASCRVPEDCDLCGFWIVDGSCPRELLGRGAKRLTFEDKVSRNMVVDSGSAASAMSAPVAAAARAHAPWTGAGVHAPAATIPGPVPTAATLAAASAAETAVAVATAAAEAATAAAVQPPTKKQRLLKLLRSEKQASADDREAECVEDILSRIKRAAKANVISTPSSEETSSVHFWSRQVVGALRSAGGETAATPSVTAAPALEGGVDHGTLAAPVAAAPASCSLTSISKQYSMLKEHFAFFLLQTLYECPCWNQIQPFIGIFKDLASLGCVVPCDLNAFVTFATAVPADTKLCPSKFASSDLAAAVTFFGCALYRDLLQHRSRALLAEAKVACTAGKRHEFLQLFMECAVSLDGDAKGECAKQRSWCASLFLTKYQTRPKWTSCSAPRRRRQVRRKSRHQLRPR